jgi:pimeloyl-ACP methyl ester carboxylesterase
MYLAHAFQRDLERDFVVVQWDRRGAGKSYQPDLGPTLTSEQLLADASEITDALRMRFHHDRIYLVGHSWGTYLGMLLISRRPDLYRAYVGIGQLARSSPIAGIQDAFIIRQATARNDQDALRQMATEPRAVRETLLFRYGGELHHATSFTPLLLAGLRAPEYSLRDALDVPKGVSLYSRSFVYNSIQGELSDAVKSVTVPVYFFTGRYDYTDPFTLTEQYLAGLAAPTKRLIWFDNSAHFPFFEEPTVFAWHMAAVLHENPEN